MAKRVEGGLVEPIGNAARPGTLAALTLTILRFSSEGDPYVLKLLLVVGAIMFLLSSFFIFFYSIYPTRHNLWTLTAGTFFIGLCCTTLSSMILLIII